MRRAKVLPSRIIHLLSLFILFFIVPAVKAEVPIPDFQPVGYENISTGTINFTRTLVDNQGDVYLIYGATRQHVQMKKFIDGEWTNYGPVSGLYSYDAKDFDIAISPAGNFYAITQDTSGSHLELYQLSGGEWLKLADVPNSKEKGRIAIMPDGSIYLSYRTLASTLNVVAYNFNSQTFKETAGGQVATGYEADLFVSPKGVLHMAVATLGGRTLSYDGINWNWGVAVIDEGSNIESIEMTVDHYDNVYVSYLDFDDKIFALKSTDGGAFEHLSVEPLIAEKGWYHDIRADGQGNMFAIVSDWSSTQILYYDNNTWVQALNLSSSSDTSLIYHTSGKIFASFGSSNAATIVSTAASTGGNPPTDPDTGEPLGETDPIYQAEKHQYALKEEIPQHSQYVTYNELSTVATSGSYQDLSDKPDLTPIHGEDGFSPTIVLDENANITITDINGTSSQNIKGADGENGINGTNGFSPSASIDALGNVSITDVNGTTTANVKGANGSSVQVSADGGTITVVNIDGTSSSIDINALISERIAASGESIWANVDINGNYLNGNGINPATVNRISRGIYHLCVEDTSLIAPLAIQITPISSSAGEGGLNLFSTSQAGLSNGCFKVFSRGVTGGSEHWDTAFSVSVNGLAVGDQDGASEVARVTLSADGRSIISASGNVNTASNTHVEIAWEKVAWVIATQEELANFSDYYVEAVTPGVFLQSDFVNYPVGVQIGEIDGYHFWSFRCVDPNQTVTATTGVIDCQGGTYRLMKR